MKKRLICIGTLTLGLGIAGLFIPKSALIPVTADSPVRVYLLDNQFAAEFPKVHVWDKNNNSNNNGWPGESMKKDQQNRLYFDVDSRYNMIIFNDGGGNQTGDLSVDASKPYYYHKANIWSSDDALAVGTYLTGDFCEWDFLSENLMEGSDNGDYFIARNKVLPSGELKVCSFNEDKSSFWYDPNMDWYSALVSWPSVGDKTWRNDKKVGITLTGDETLNADVRLNLEGDKCEYQLVNTPNISVVIGEDSHPMVTNLYDLAEVTATVDGVASNASIEFFDGSTLLASKFKEEAGNNVRNGQTIVGGEHLTITYNRFNPGAITTWVTGYSELMSFSRQLLSSTIYDEDGEGEISPVCDDPSDIEYSGETDLWEHLEEDFTNLSLSQIGYFYGLTTSVDYEAPSFTDDVEQAAARYCYLRHKYTGLKDFVAIANGAEPSSAKIVPIVSAANEYTAPLVTLCASLGIIGAIGGAILIRKRHF